MDILVLKDTLKKLVQINYSETQEFNFKKHGNDYVIESYRLSNGGTKHVLLKSNNDGYAVSIIPCNTVLDLTVWPGKENDKNQTYISYRKSALTYVYSPAGASVINCFGNSWSPEDGLERVVLNYPVQEDEYFQKSTIIPLLEPELIDDYMEVFREICTGDIVSALIARNNHTLTSEEIRDMFEEYISFVHSSAVSAVFEINK